ncbi:hypothetical protein F2P56_002168 [Juglans regia]|uniref:Uncharacterized protein LOC109019108 n=2 Tax=Juglans regia TaxID=51240 RepID=A0A2I4HL31_JUGRE|nr:uncharacterized protein LOC109019108 [Juglans regia]KAF5481526.1 hypothetical protein F2P56_002168 [Juglans regia]
MKNEVNLSQYSDSGNELMEKDNDKIKAGIENSQISSEPKGASGSSSTSSNTQKSETMIIGIRDQEISKFLSTEDEKSKPDQTDTTINIDVGSNCNEMSAELLDAEKDSCRICHLSSEQLSRTTSLIQLGCSCKGELGISHRHCAEAWFRSKGNRLCEICGETAKNIAAIEDTRLILGMNGIRPVMASTRNSSESEITCSRRRHFKEFLVACLILAFILPWVISRRL